MSDDQVPRLVIRRLWRDWVAPYRGRIGLALCLMVVVAATSSAYPALISEVFNRLQNNDFATIFYVPIAIIALSSIRAIAMYLQVLTVNKLALRVTTDIQKKMTSHLIEADLSWLTGEPTGSFISRIMNDLNIVREALVRLANNLVRDLLTIIAMVATMMWFDWMLTLLVLAVYPLAMRPIVRIGNAQRKASGNLQEHLEDVTSLLGETLGGARMVKAFQLEDVEKQRSHKAFESLFARLVNLLAGRAKIDPILESLGGVAVAGVIALASYQVARGQMQIGDVIGFITALLLLVQPVRALGTLNAVTQEAAAAGKRIFELLDRDNLITDKKEAGTLVAQTAALRFDKVCLTIGETSLIQNVSFTAPAGQTIALVGPSGAGKTSVINLVPRFLDVTSGSISINDQPIDDVTIHSLRKHIALVSQEAVIFDDTVAANIAFGRRDASREEIIQAAKDAAAHEFISQLENGYDTRLGATGNRLSGGQKQRLAIARAIVKDAPILLLDEATSALDAEAEKQVQTALETLSKGRTCLVIAHRLSTIQSADHIIVLDSGRIVEQGNHHELLAQNGLYARLCALQTMS
ncbi:MAG: ABC transporter ATP-binding protein [Candidatus Puniceispirillaceae bacterium]